mmetsp:Transcript_28768/g.81141  ORF Transcript_28768/g.81141 Transcript_28768/m.81141 type:complete len:471 (+) Transcript_28768:128-1540(+)
MSLRSRDQCLGKFGDLRIRHVQHQTLFEFAQRDAVAIPPTGKARIIALVHHDLHETERDLRIGAGLQESFDEETLEFLVAIGILASHDFDVLVGEFERCAFHAEFVSRCHSHGETEIDEDQMSLRVDHDVAVVAVLQAEEVGDQRVGGQTPHEVLLGLLEGLAVGTIVGFHKVLAHAAYFWIPVGLFESVDGGGIDQYLNEAGAAGRAQDAVRLQPERELGLGEDGFVVVDHLHDEDLLSQIVVGFGHETDDFVLSLVDLLMGFGALSQHSERLFGPAFAVAHDLLGAVEAVLVDVAAVLVGAHEDLVVADDAAAADGGLVVVLALALQDGDDLQIGGIIQNARTAVVTFNARCQLARNGCPTILEEALQPSVAAGAITAVVVGLFAILVPHGTSFIITTFGCTTILGIVVRIRNDAVGRWCHTSITIIVVIIISFFLNDLAFTVIVEQIELLVHVLGDIQIGSHVAFTT